MLRILSTAPRSYVPCRAAWISQSLKPFSTPATPAPIEDLVSRLKTDLKLCMRTGEKKKTTVIKSLLSDLTYAAKSPSGMGDGPVEVIQKALKKRMDSVDAYKAGGRDELVSQELEEVTIIQGYLPKQLTPEELETVVRSVVAKVGATSAKDVGKVMKAIGGEIVAGSATKKNISDVVKKVLTSL
ncbi:hypothetical protein HDU67_002752 [Dinochytrium kinnereticum]|nr:hypothetical protein HDU67_002752 [Dinochytrium kinnereticum]